MTNTCIFPGSDHVKAQVPFPLNRGEVQLHEPLAKGRGGDPGPHAGIQE